ncbi:putative spermidine/putrescine transport system permease protein [Leucobacter exalbidus]|uniref:Spermidine/putrescine transport system permease protein n=1 Tax=Leucobacter exalbidus TaxID=662960 RepID=A0A940PVM4_9MICO|nr:ABC transporter permease [Leucobacter exalbidus]MBP1326031.1 putative spermidine/putrescine transport system permease protein [Leucobacter exalbidus]
MPQSPRTSEISTLSTRAIRTAALPKQRRPLSESGRKRPGLLLALLPAFVVLAIFYFYPMFSVLLMSFTDPEPGLQNFEWFFSQPVNLQVLWRTLIISFWVTIICVILAFPFAFFLTIVKPSTRGLLMLVVLIPFWTSMVVRTFAWVILLQDSGPIGQFMKLFGVDELGIMRTPTAVLIGMAQVLMPFVVLPIYTTMSKIDMRLLTAARSLGARPSKAFVTVYLPLSLPGIASGTLLCFVMALGFYITPAMLGSSREAFLSTLIQGQVQGQSNWGYGSAIGLVLLVVTLIILGVTSAIGRKTGGSVHDMVGGSKA